MSFRKYCMSTTKTSATTGDMPNDAFMFKNSEVSIAMGNASSDVQHAARFVTKFRTRRRVLPVHGTFVSSSARHLRSDLKSIFSEQTGFSHDHRGNGSLKIEENDHWHNACRCGADF